jgi:hypothetical protein
MASDVNQRACVVEVVEQVADADVAIVAARVGERLAMSPDRVRKLIEGRTGPITRALRADKADAIAQTFEAAGVRVVIRPAEPEEIEDLPGAVTKSTAERAAAAVPPPAPGPADRDAGPGSAREPRVDPEPAPDAVAEPEPVRPPREEFAAAPEPGQPEGEPEAEAGPGPEREPEPQEGDTPEPAYDDLDEDELEPHDAPADREPEPDDEAGELEPEPDDEAGELEPEPDDEAGELEPEPDDEAVELEPEPGDEAGEFEPEPDDEPTEPGVDPHDAGAPGDDPVHDADAALEGAPRSDRDASDDALGHDAGTADSGVIDVDAEQPASGEGRPRARSKFTSTGEWVEGDAGVWSTARPARDSGEADDWPADEGDAGAEAAIVVDDDDDAAGAAAPVGRGGRRPRAVVMPVGDASAPRSVPLAWRGLGPEPAGPARPPDAPVPRRQEADPPIEIPDPRRRRRAVMLGLLAIAVIAFLLSQWWVASRAGAAVDATAGIHAYRDGDFAAARRYWGAQAGAGDPAAQFMLGYLAEAGLGAPWSARAAAAWYRAAADGGHAEAAWRLGRLYEAGLGVAPDDGEARRWFRAAADLGHGEAAFALGRSWMRELGVVWFRDGTATWPVGVVEELTAAFARAADLGFHEAAPYAASLAAARVAGLP